jgi:hypothetical protein
VEQKNRNEAVLFVSRWESGMQLSAHNLKVLGSNPSPATNFEGLAAMQALFA